MTSPVSIGDAIMLSRIAYDLARTFTSGRKSAPAEFQEVQNQLYALGGALGFLANDRTETMDKSRVGSVKSGEGNKAEFDQDGILDQMISNCRMTLKHLEEIVDKYMVIDPSAANQGPTSLKSWRQDVKKIWRKIRWTTEGGDLDKLRSNLAVHINGLNLALSAMHRCVMPNSTLLCLSQIYFSPALVHKRETLRIKSMRFTACLRTYTNGTSKTLNVQRRALFPQNPKAHLG
jgi:hypothetical protein